MQPSERQRRDRRLVENIQRGDERAFEMLFRAYCDELCSFIRLHIHAPEASEDLVQDLFYDLWERRHVLNPQGTVKAYLYRAARNKSLNWLKHRRVRRRWEAEEKQRDPACSNSPEEALRDKELTRAMEQAVQDLPKRRRLIFTLSRRQGMSYAEIAAALDISPKTVKNQMARALKFLRARFSTLL